MPTLHIVVEPHAPDHLKQVVDDGLGSYHVTVTGFAEYYPVAIFLKDAHDAVLGGRARAYLGQVAAHRDPLAR
jgi:hypothetical protein